MSIDQVIDLRKPARTQTCEDNSPCSGQVSGAKHAAGCSSTTFAELLLGFLRILEFSGRVLVIVILSPVLCLMLLAIWITLNQEETDLASKGEGTGTWTRQSNPAGSDRLIPPQIGSL